MKVAVPGDGRGTCAVDPPPTDEGRGIGNTHRVPSYRPLPLSHPLMVDRRRHGEDWESDEPLIEGAGTLCIGWAELDRNDYQTAYPLLLQEDYEHDKYFFKPRQNNISSWSPLYIPLIKIRTTH